MSKYILIFTKLAYPWLDWWTMKICVLLLDSTLSGSDLVKLGRTTSRFSGRRRLLLRLSSLWKRRISVGGRRIRSCTIDIGTRLSTLSGYFWRIGTNGRSSAGNLRMMRGSRSGGRVCAWWLRVLSIFLAGPHHLIRRIRTAGEGELCFACTVLGSFLLEQAHVLITGWRRGCLRVSNGS